MSFRGFSRLCGSLTTCVIAGAVALFLSNKNREHKVLEGGSLEWLAAKYGTTEKALKKLNNMKDDIIYSCRSIGKRDSRITIRSAKDKPNPFLKAVCRSSKEAGSWWPRTEPKVSTYNRKSET